MGPQGEVFFLKMNNGDDILCMLIGDDPDCLWITQPYLVELVQNPMNFTVTPTIMRWFPFDSLLHEKVRVDKKNIITYMIVDEEVAGRYLNTIDTSQSKQREREYVQELIKRRNEVLNNLANTATGTIH